MKLVTVLRRFKFGSDVAEHDSDLSSYFVETSAFYDIVGDEADVLLGAKGTGKTAIARTLADPNRDIPELANVDIVPAFNTHGSVMFRTLASAGNVGEDQLRSAWLVYFAALIGNHLIDTYGETADVSALEEQLSNAGLLVVVDRPKSVWDRVRDALGRTLNPTSLEGSLTFGPNGVPTVSGKAHFSDTATSSDDTHQFDAEALLGRSLEVLESVDRCCWIVLDRLDEAFQHDRALEREALRGLMRAHLDISSYGNRLRSKLFMRSDLLERITAESGFVNATHMRLQRIRWDARSLSDVVVRRIVENDVFAEMFPNHPESPQSDTERGDVLGAVLPRVMESNVDTLAWIIQRTVDGTGDINPRNVLTLLKLARIAQLKICDRDDPDLLPNGPLMSAPAFRDALRELSTIRLDDTLYAEFQPLREHVERLRSRPYTFTRGDLARILGLDAEGDELQAVVREMKYSGFVSESASRKLTVPALYRVALNMASKRLSAEELAMASARSDELGSVRNPAHKDKVGASTGDGGCLGRTLGGSSQRIARAWSLLGGTRHRDADTTGRAARSPPRTTGDTSRRARCRTPVAQRHARRRATRLARFS